MAGVWLDGHAVAFTVHDPNRGREILVTAGVRQHTRLVVTTR